LVFPSKCLVESSVADTSIECILSVAEITMAALPSWAVAGALGAAVVFAFLMDLVKVPLFRELVARRLDWRVGALRRYPSCDTDEFGLPELAHSVERFDRDGNLGRTSGVVA
jgi:hypothetical protein